MQTFKDRFNPKVKKNHVPFGMLFIQIMSTVGANVFDMETFTGASQLIWVTLVKMEIAVEFPKYDQKHIKKKVKKEPKEEPQFVVGQILCLKLHL